MAKKEFTYVLRNKVGLHARPATMFVKTCKKFDSDIKVQKAGFDKIADGKKILSILSIGAEKDDKVTITIIGEDAEGAEKKLKKLLESNFGEE